jgi:hypothetical protein
VGTGSSSLLRRLSARGARLALLAGLVMTVGTPTAEAAVASPDPSPSASVPAPDPYPTFSPPAPAPSEPAALAGASSVQRPQISTRRVAPTGGAARSRTHRPAGRRQTPQPAHAQNKAAAVRVRLPIHPAPGLGARVAAAVGVAVAVEPQQRVSRTLALAVGLLVLLSAGFVAGAAREVAR